MSLATERADFIDALKRITNGDLMPDMLDSGVWNCAFCSGIIEYPEGFKERVHPEYLTRWFGHRGWCPVDIATKVLEKHGVKV